MAIANLETDKGPKGDTGAQGPKGDKGDTGNAGANGTNGAPGAPGAPGADGTKWFNGLGDPGEFSEANANDFYLDGENGQVWIYDGEDWSTTDTNLQGPPGDQGPQGDPGEQGPQGDPGADGPPGGGPDGGTTLQVLRKTSDTDQDYDWYDNDYLKSSVSYVDGMTGALRFKPAGSAFGLSSWYLDDGRYDGSNPIGHSNVDFLFCWYDASKIPMSANTVRSFLVSGYDNRIKGFSESTFIIAGVDNQANSSSNSGIAASEKSNLNGCQYSFIAASESAVADGGTRIFFGASRLCNSGGNSQVAMFGSLGYADENNCINWCSFTDIAGINTAQLRNVRIKIGGTKGSVWIGPRYNYTNDGLDVAAENSLFLQTVNTGNQSKFFALRSGLSTTVSQRAIFPDAQAKQAGDELYVTGVTLTSGVYETQFAWRATGVKANGAGGSALTVDFSTGRLHTITLSAALTLTFSNPVAGQRYDIVVTQDTTPRAITWPAAVKWPGGTPPTLSAGSGAKDVISLLYDGTNYYSTFAQAFA